MSSFKKNRPIPKVTEYGENIINQAEDAIVSPSSSKYVKEITVPFTKEMHDLLETVFNHFDQDISRRKLCAKYLLKALRSEASNLK